MTEMGWDLWVASFRYFFMQKRELFAFERVLEACKLVDYDPERPDVALRSVGLMLPNFWWAIVRSSSHGAHHPFLRDRRYIQVSKLDSSVPAQEDVG